MVLCVRTLFVKDLTGLYTKQLITRTLPNQIFKMDYSSRTWGLILVFIWYLRDF